MEPIYDYLAKWNKNTDSLGKMQGAYAVMAITVFLLAAIVSLVNQNLGQSILFLAFVLGLAFIGNGVVWALVRTFVIPRIQAKKPTTTRKK